MLLLVLLTSQAVPDVCPEVWISGPVGLSPKHPASVSGSFSIPGQTWLPEALAAVRGSMSCLPFQVSPTWKRNLPAEFSLLWYLLPAWSLGDLQIVTRSGLRTWTLRVVTGESLGHILGSECVAAFLGNGK